MGIETSKTKRPPPPLSFSSLSLPLGFLVVSALLCCVAADPVWDYNCINNAFPNDLKLLFCINCTDVPSTSSTTGTTGTTGSTTGSTTGGTSSTTGETTTTTTTTTTTGITSLTKPVSTGTIVGATAASLVIVLLVGGTIAGIFIVRKMKAGKVSASSSSSSSKGSSHHNKSQRKPLVKHAKGPLVFREEEAEVNDLELGYQHGSSPMSRPTPPPPIPPLPYPSPSLAPSRHTEMNPHLLHSMHASVAVGAGPRSPQPPPSSAPVAPPLLAPLAFYQDEGIMSLASGAQAPFGRMNTYEDSIHHRNT